jgi:hypothetical protein
VKKIKREMGLLVFAPGAAQSKTPTLMMIERFGYIRN